MRKKFYSLGVSKCSDWQEYKSIISYFFNNIKLFVDIYDYEFSPVKTIDSNSLNRTITSGSKEDFIILLESEKDQFSEFNNKYYFSDIINSLKSNAFETKILVGNSFDYYEKNIFSNPFSHLINKFNKKKIDLINNEKSITCLIEDPYLIPIKEIINELGILKIKNFIVLKSVIGNDDQITLEKVDDKNVYTIPITKHFRGGDKNNKSNYTNRFHDRNIITNDYWINLGNSFKRVNFTFYTQTQLFLSLNLLNLKSISYKISGTFKLINKHCLEVNEKRKTKTILFDRFIDFDNPVINANDINFIFDQYIKLFDLLIKERK